MGEGLRVCRKCLYDRESEAEYFANLQKYIEQLEDASKVPQEVYERRLSVCRVCPRRSGSMCTLCGCFVELRACLRVRACPDTPRRWEREEDGNEL